MTPDPTAHTGGNADDDGPPADEPLTVDETDGVTVATVVYRNLLDSSTAETVGTALEELVAQRSTVLLVVHLEAVEFISSSFLGRLIQIRRTLEGRGGVLGICAPADQIREFFGVTRMDKLLPVRETVSDAVTAVKAAS